MKTIVERNEFEEIINQVDGVVFFVHSNWSMTSLIGLKRIEEFIDSSDFSKFIVIDNTSAQSFIYDWLKEQEKMIIMTGINKSLKPRVGSWIHGNGELFRVRNRNIDWFEGSTYKLSQEQLIEKIK